MQIVKRVYADNNATTCVHPDVLNAMLPYFSEQYGNASSMHAWGREAREAVDTARVRVAALVDAQPEEIFFTSGGTESDNWALKGIVAAHQGQGARALHIITTSIEHHAVLNVGKYFAKKGCVVTYLPVDTKGRVSVDDVKAAITDDTVLVSVMYANNEVGTIQPIQEIGALLRDVNAARTTKGLHPIVFHTDAVQAAGKILIDVKELNVDMLSLSAHKINGPKGIGTLYIRRGTKIDAMLHGGHHERMRRAGTENVPAIVGFGIASEIALRDFETEHTKLLQLKKLFITGLQKTVDEIYFNGDLENSLANTVNVSFNYVEGESIIMNLDLKGVAVSSGSACTSGSLESSHVLKAMHVDPVLAQGSIRFSFGRFNTEEDVAYILNALPEIIERLRAMSPLYKKKL